VILDATFAQRRYRDKVIRLADRHQVPVYFLHCVAPDGVTKKRDRAMDPNEVLDARWEIYLEQKALKQPLDELSTSSCLELVTDKSIEHLRQISEEFLRAGLSVVLLLSRGDPAQCSCRAWHDGQRSSSRESSSCSIVIGLWQAAQIPWRLSLIRVKALSI
jgi:hypothetical protein